MFKGSQPTDGARLKSEDGRYVTTSNLIVENDDRATLLADCPQAENWLRPFIGGDELISGQTRWCLWLKNVSPSDYSKCSEIMRRLQRVRDGRAQSSTPSVREFAKYPMLFTQDRQPDSDYLALSRVSSERREYIPIAILDKTIIAHEKLLIVPSPPDWLFPLLTSAMHMGWMRTVSGRLESRYSYAPAVYNSFPWPDLDDAAKKSLASAGQAILDARYANVGATLELLYYPDKMPVNLRKAHEANDRLVDSLYQRARFPSERARVEHLFGLFEKRMSPIEAAAATPRSRRRSTNGD